MALWIDEQQVADRRPRSRTRGDASNDDRQDFGGQTTEFKVKLTAGDHWHRGRDAANFRRTARALCRTESVDAAGAGREAIQAAAGRARRSGSRN